MKILTGNGWEGGASAGEPLPSVWEERGPNEFDDETAGNYLGQMWFWDDNDTTRMYMNTNATEGMSSWWYIGELE